MCMPNVAINEIVANLLCSIRLYHAESIQYAKVSTIVVYNSTI